jgi:hypothetical protein
MNLASNLTANQKARVTTLAAAWTMPGSEFDFVVQEDDDNTWNSDENEIGWATRPAGETSLATTFTTFTLCQSCDSWTCGGSSCTSGKYTAADIKLWNDVSYTMLAPLPNESGKGMGVSSTGATYFDIIMSHELGHAAGLTHSNFWDMNGGMSRMESRTPCGGWFNPSFGTVAGEVTPLAQDNFMLATMYPGSGASSDLYALNAQHIDLQTGDPETESNSWPLSVEYGGGYDFFPQNQVTRGTGTAEEMRRTAKVGDKINIRACFGNKGGAAFAAAAPVRFWLSASPSFANSPTASPTVLSYPAGSIGANVQWCEVLTFVVPTVTRAAAGTLYYIIIDINNAVLASNNWALHNRRLKVIP